MVFILGRAFHSSGRDSARKDLRMRVYEVLSMERTGGGIRSDVMLALHVLHRRLTSAAQDQESAGRCIRGRADRSVREKALHEVGSRCESLKSNQQQRTVTSK